MNPRRRRPVARFPVVQAVTLIIHGTFASAADWWKLGPDGGEFADKLESELAAHGMAGTVWQPALDAGLSYDDFTWSGKNRHDDRVQGARKLANSIERLAASAGATAADPLEVNIVAHSHGGNVALEMLNLKPESVQIRKLALLGTPLVWRYASARIFAIATAVVLFWSLIGGMLLGILEATIEDSFTAEASYGSELVIVFLFSLAFGLLLVFLIMGPYLWLIARPFAWAETVLSWMFSWLSGGPAGKPAYGPKPGSGKHQLGAAVESPPILMTSREDEADLALHIGASPREVYRAMLRKRLKGVMRYIEPLYLRGSFSVFVAPLLEVATEHYVLGFRWRKVLFNDFQMVTFGGDDDTYSGAIQRVDVSADVVPALRERLSKWTPSSAQLMEATEGLGETDRHVEALRGTLLGVGRDLSTQMQLRHTVYYETPAVVERLAVLLAGEQHPAEVAGS